MNTSKILTFLNSLEENNISYSLTHVRSEAIMVQVAVPGERWEVEFMNNGEIEFEKFISTGHIGDLDELICDLKKQEVDNIELFTSE